MRMNLTLSPPKKIPGSALKKIPEIPVLRTKHLNQSSNVLTFWLKTTICGDIVQVEVSLMQSCYGLRCTISGPVSLHFPV